MLHAAEVFETLSAQLRLLAVKTEALRKGFLRRSDMALCDSCRERRRPATLPRPHVSRDIGHARPHIRPETTPDASRRLVACLRYRHAAAATGRRRTVRFIFCQHTFATSTLMFLVFMLPSSMPMF